MAQVTRKQLLPGVWLTAVHTKKFKSAVMSLNLLTPLNKQNASANAAVPYILRRGTMEKPDMNRISAALDELYGGSIEPVVRKKGESQCVGFVCSFLDDAYTLNGEKILEPAAGLLGELLLNPCMKDGAFLPEYVESEKTNLVNRIRAQINDKRQYSVRRLGQIMCREEAYGISAMGDEETAVALTGEAVRAAYENLLGNARVELYYCGCAGLERVEVALRDALKGLPVNENRVALSCEVKVRPDGAPKVEEEAMDVTQGKLAMGFRTGGASIWEEDYPALLVFNAVYGGTATSKLFMNVREKLSLCYFASSMLDKQKGIMLVSSGIEFEKYEQAKNEILAQLEACQKDDMEEWEMAGAVRSVVSALQTTLDSQGRMEDYWLDQAVAGLNESPEALVKRVEKVSRRDVVAMANRMTLDSVYFLKGKEG